MVYPSSYLLPGLQNRPVALTRRHLYSTFLPSWSSSFFHHFSNTFFRRSWLHLGSQNGSQIHQKPFKNRSKNLIGKTHYFWGRFFFDFQWILDPTSLENTAKTMGGHHHHHHHHHGVSCEVYLATQRKSRQLSVLGGVSLFMFSLVLFQERFQHAFHTIFVSIFHPF